jgi:tetratricopeptide (TPR) repeat protein
LKKVYFDRIFLILLIISGLFFSCKSAPKEAAQPEPEPTAVEEVEVEEEVIIEDESPEVIGAAPVVEVIIPETTPAADPDMAGLQERYDELGDILTMAQAKRQEIMNEGFYEKNQQPFDLADNALKRAAEAYNAGIGAVNESSMVDARFALDSFTAIIDGVWLSRADAARIKSSYAQQQALKLKADVAVKDRYSLAAELHNKGESALRDNDYAAAIDFYEEAAPVFAEALKTASEKRERAALALKSAEQKIVESEKIVDDAVKFIENSAGEKGEVL